jgi:pyridinium-3,5-biscarboxylic acid mononucleotide sulfurtransferase
LASAIPGTAAAARGLSTWRSPRAPADPSCTPRRRRRRLVESPAARYFPAMDPLHTQHPGSAGLDDRYARLRDILRSCESVCIGYSGGVDSVFLAVTAVSTLGPDRVLAVTGVSAAYPAVQRDAAVDCARRFGIPHVEIRTDELQDPGYASNPANRCYYCKSELWPKVARVSRERGLRAVLDGSNADDAHDYRPGTEAAREHGVRSPLLEAGLTKEDIRQLSRNLGLPTWDQPSAPCLSSRLPYGVAVTVERLRQVEVSEAALREIGFRELRVRHHDDCVRIELGAAELDAASERASAMHVRLSALRLPPVLLDAEGYRRGALNEVLVQLGTDGRGLASDNPREPQDLPPHRQAGHHGDIAVLAAPDFDAARAAAPALRAAGYQYVALDLADLARRGAQ